MTAAHLRGREHPAFIPFEDEQLKRMAELYNAGKTFAQLSESYGVSETVIKRRLLEQGVQLRSRGKRRIYTASQMVEVDDLRASGTSWEAIADRFDCPIRRIQARYYDWKAEQT